MANTSKNQALNPTVPTNNTVVPLPPEAVPRLLTDVFFAPLRVILEYGWLLDSSDPKG